MGTEKSSVKKIVVDSGKFGTKSIARNSNGEIVKLYFQTKMDETNETSTNAEGTYAIEINNERFLLGKNASDVNDYDTTKTKNLHKYAIYTAVHQLTNDKDEVSIIVGCPISVYKNKNSREKYEEFIKGDGNIEMVVNNVRKSFKIVSVNSLPESSGYIFKNMSKFIDRMVAIVDIGGLNVNGSIYEGVDMLPGSDFTANLGANVLRNNLRRALNSEFESNLSIRQTEEAMKNRSIRKDPNKSKDFINNEFISHVESILQEMKANQWDIYNLDFVFVGGGSLLLKEEITKVFGDHVTISEEAVWDNAEGFAQLINL